MKSLFNFLGGAVAVFGTVFGLCFAVTAFLLGSTDVAAWPGDVRLACVLFAFVLSVIVVAFWWILE